jgi:hypothetical protein
MIAMSRVDREIAKLELERLRQTIRKVINDHAVDEPSSAELDELAVLIAQAVFTEVNG